MSGALDGGEVGFEDDNVLVWDGLLGKFRRGEMDLGNGYRGRAGVGASGVGHCAKLSGGVYRRVGLGGYGIN